jgi:hypothetical protein
VSVYLLFLFDLEATKLFRLKDFTKSDKKRTIHAMIGKRS